MIRKISIVLLALVLMLSSVSALATEERNPEYDKVFSDARIFRMDQIFFMMDSSGYVINGDGFIHNLEFGHKDDVICSYVETVYLHTEGMSDADKEALDQNMKATYAAYEGMQDVSINYYNGPNYYVLTTSANNLDNMEQLQAVLSAGLIAADSQTTFLSMAMTDESLLAGGYIKR